MSRPYAGYFIAGLLVGQPVRPIGWSVGTIADDREKHQLLASASPDRCNSKWINESGGIPAWICNQPSVFCPKKQEVTRAARKNHAAAIVRTEDFHELTRRSLEPRLHAHLVNRAEPEIRLFGIGKDLLGNYLSNNHQCRLPELPVAGNYRPGRGWIDSGVAFETCSVSRAAEKSCRDQEENRESAAR